MRGKCFKTIVALMVILSVPTCCVAVEITLDADDWNNYDCRTVIQNALDTSGATKVTLAQAGDNVWRVRNSLLMNSNQEFHLNQNVTIRAEGNNFDPSEALIRLEDKSNVTISGYNYSTSEIVWSPTSCTYSSGEWRHGIGIRGCTNVTVQNLKVGYTFGDGVCIAGSQYGGNAYSSGVTVQYVHVLKASRNAISIVGGQNILIDQCTLQQTEPMREGVAANGPWAGIDIEPDNTSQPCSNIDITNVNSLQHKGSGLTGYFGGYFSGSSPVPSLDIMVDGVTISDCDQNGIWFAEMHKDSGGSVYVRNTTIQNCDLSGISVRNKYFYSSYLKFDNVTINNCNLSAATGAENRAPVVVWKSWGGEGNAGYVDLYNVKVQNNNTSYAYSIEGYDNTTNGKIHDVWGTITRIDGGPTAGYEVYCYATGVTVN